MSTISVVIPSRNDAEMLSACLAALARQTRPADEVIVVDNGSRDNTAAVCAAAGVRRIAVDLSGIAASTAKGFDEATSEVIARLDTDSVPPTDWLERVEAILDGAGPFAAVTGPGDFYGGSRFSRWLGRNVYIAGYFWAIGHLLGHPPLFGSNFALRSGVWKLIRCSVSRGLPPVHDDLDISYQLPPEVTVICEPTLRVGVSARPFESWQAVGRRLSMAWTTFRIEFAKEPPLRRRRRRKRWEHGHPA
ncbi:glycosyltransferase family 2 protein [Arthrobacter sp. PAMC25564]|uniref:glycosyltransferase family 2 protein n=1 Tax=Arthrobacter sp. PAMC25564 TaxID=2565366 RepID=UPI0010A296D4|nr:glycosyltransferase family 2 protein [Arthrobacter sp. PAMC25564]QCB95718.1 glycosyltransferase family 2 protein [Arthrobacter sp. PAMC25564]